MRLTAHRAVALLAGVWLARDAAVVAGWGGGALALGIAWTALWGLATVLLWQGRRPVVAGLALAGLCLVELAVLDQWPEYGLILLAWAGAALAVTAGRPAELALALRVLVSSVYVFGALTKLQPAWLAGDNLRYLQATRPQAEAVLGFAGPSLLVVLAAGTVAAELALGIGLWFRRTRTPAALAGVALHLGLVALAAKGGWPGLLHLVLLNFGLVLLYPAFWSALPARRPDPTLP